MTQPGTDQHKGGVSIWETPYHTGTAANLPVQSLNNVVGSNTSPMFWWKIAVSQSFLNAVLYLFSGLFRLHGPQFFYHSFGFLSCCFLVPPYPN